MICIVEHAFFMPAFNLMITCIVQGFSEVDRNTSYVGLIIAGMVGIILLLFFVSISLKITIPLQTKSSTSRLNNYFIISILIHKASISLILIFNIWSENIFQKETVWLLTMLNFLQSVGSSFILTSFSPFIHPKVLSIFIALQASLISANLSNVIQLIKAASFMLGSSSHLFQSMIIFIFVYKFLGNLRISLLSKFIGAQKFYVGSDAWFKLKLMIHCKNPKDFKTDYFFEKDLRGYLDALKYNLGFNAKEFLIKFLKDSNDIQAKLIAASMLFDEFDDFIISYNLSNTVLNNPLTSVSLKFGALYLKNKIDRKLGKMQSLEADRKTIESYFFFDKSCKNIKDKISSFLESYISFYQLLNQESPCLKEVASFSKKIQSKFKHTLKLWNTISEKFEKVPLQLLRTFSIFLTGIKIKGHELEEIHTQYKLSLITQNQKDVSSVDRLIKNTKNFCVFSSIQPSTLGKLLGLSNSVRNVLGYSSQELKGRSINSMFAKIVADCYDEFNKLILSSEFTGAEVLRSPSFLLHKKGYVIPCETISIHCLFDDRELCYGTLITVPEVQGDYLLLDKNGKIVGTTLDYKPLLNLDLQSLCENKNCFNEANSTFYLNPKLVYSNLKIDDNLITSEFLEKLETLTLTSTILNIGSETIRVIKIEEIQTFQTLGSSLFPKILSRVVDESVDKLNIGIEREDLEVGEYVFSKMISQHEEFVRQKTKVATKNSVELEIPPIKIIHLNQKNTKKNSTEHNTEISEKKATFVRDNNDQQSVMTTKSEASTKKLEIIFSELQKKLSFSKFRHSYILFIIYLLFIILFAITIFVTYSHGRDSNDMLSGRIKLIVQITERKQMLLQLARAVWLDQYITNYLGPFLTPEILYRFKYVIQLEAVTIQKAAVSISSSIERNVNELEDDELNKLLYEKNIRVYYGDFVDMFTTENYYIMNNFQATNYLLSSFGNYLQKIMNQDDNSVRQRNLIFANSYNDYLIVNENLEKIIQRNIENILAGVSHVNKTVYICCFCFLILYLVSLGIIITLYYKHTVTFLSLFPNHPAHDINDRVKNLEKLKLYIETDSKKDYNIRRTFFQNEKVERKYHIKNCKVKELFKSIFLIRVCIFVALIIPSLIMLSISFGKSLENEDFVKFEIDNILKLNDIGYKTIVVFHQHLLNMIYFNRMIFKNTLVDNILDQNLKDMGNSVSASQNFSPEIESMLSENLCNYFIQTTDIACEEELKGIGEKGSRALVYYVQQIFVEDRAILKVSSYTPLTIFQMLSRPFGQEMYDLILNAMLPAIRSFIKKIESNLISHLEMNLDDVIKIFWISIVTNLLSLGGMIGVIYGKIIKERSKIVNTINFVPIDFILMNIHFKIYLVKEDKEFIKLFKMKDHVKSIGKPVKKI